MIPCSLSTAGGRSSGAVESFPRRHFPGVQPRHPSGTCAVRTHPREAARPRGRGFGADNRRANLVVVDGHQGARSDHERRQSAGYWTATRHPPVVGHRNRSLAHWRRRRTGVERCHEEPAVVTDNYGFGPLGAVSQGIAVVTVANGIEAFRLADGEPLWSAGADRFFPQARLSAPVTFWDLSPVTIAGHRVLTLAENESGISWFRVFQLRSGRKIFERKGATIGSGVSTFVSAGNEIILETGFGPRPHHLIVLNAGDFSVRRRVSLDPRVELLNGGQTLVLGDGLMAVADLSLIHISEPTRRTWSVPIEFRKPFPLESQAPGPTGLVPTGGGYLVSTSDGLVHAFGPPE